MGSRRQAIAGSAVAIAVGVSAACSAAVPAAAPVLSVSPSASISASASASPSPSLSPSWPATSSAARPVSIPYATRGSARPAASSPLPAWAVSHQRPSPVCSGGCVTVGQPNLSSSVQPPYVPSTARKPHQPAVTSCAARPWGAWVAAGGCVSNGRHGRRGSGPSATVPMLLASVDEDGHAAARVQPGATGEPAAALSTCRSRGWAGTLVLDVSHLMMVTPRCGGRPGSASRYARSLRRGR